MQAGTQRGIIEASQGIVGARRPTKLHRSPAIWQQHGSNYASPFSSILLQRTWFI